MMAAALTLRLSPRQTLRAAQDVELLELLADQLANPDRGEQVLLGVAAAGQTAVEDRDTGLRCLLPAATLRMIRAAGLATLASRELAAPGVLTAALYLVAPAADASPLLGHREGWYRNPSAGHGNRSVQADLGMVLANASPGRLHDDEILLVELLGAAAVDAALAGRIGQAAAEHHLGSWIELPKRAEDK